MSMKENGKMTSEKVKAMYSCDVTNLVQVMENFFLFLLHQATQEVGRMD